MSNFLTPLLAWRRAYLSWLRSLPRPVRTLIVVGSIFLAVWPLVDNIHDLAQMGIPQEQLIACLQRYPAAKDPQAFERCLAEPTPVPIFLRHPQVTALVIAVLTAPLSLRSLRPRHTAETMIREGDRR